MTPMAGISITGRCLPRWWSRTAAIAILIVAVCFGYLIVTRSQIVIWIIYAVLALLFAYHPFWALIGVACSIPLEIVTIIPGQTLARNLGLLAVVGLAVQFASRQKKLTVWPGWAATIGLAGWSLGIGFVAVDIERHLEGWQMLARLLLLIPVCYWLVDTPKKLRLLIAGWVVGGSVASILALLQFWGLVPLFWFEGAQRLAGIEGVLRPGGPASNAGRLALEIAHLIPLALGMYATEARVKFRLFWAICTVAMVGAMIITFTRGIWLAMVVALIFWLSREELRRTVFIALLSVFAVLAILNATGYLFAAELRALSILTALEEGTGYLRLQLWRAGVNMTLANPITGVGLNNFLLRAPEFNPIVGYFRQLLGVHNWVLEVSSQLGLVGLTLFVGLLGLAFQQLRTAGRDGVATDISLQRLASYMMLALVTLLLARFTEFILFYKDPYLLIGISLASGAIARRSVETHKGGFAME